MEHLFIINPHAGKIDRSDEIRGKLAEFMAGRGLSYSTCITEYPGHATELTRTAAESGRQVRVYACGGDGTLNEVVCGAAGFSNISVTHWPTGSGNDFIKIFGEGAAHFYELSSLMECEVTPVDLIDCNGRLAINVCSVGFDARIGLGMADFKKLPLVNGSMAYQISLISNVIRGINRPYRVQIVAADGSVEQLDGKFALLCCCNGQYYGGGFHPAPEAIPDDGLLQFVLVKAVSRMTVAKVVAHYAKGRAADYPDFILLRTALELRVECDRTSMINVDGERIDASKVAFKIHDKKVNFAHPVGTSWNDQVKKTQGNRRMAAAGRV